MKVTVGVYHGTKRTKLCTYLWVSQETEDRDSRGMREGQRLERREGGFTEVGGSKVESRDVDP